jgi:branched-chain amino acid transport system substrate-binding protein
MTRSCHRSSVVHSSGVRDDTGHDAAAVEAAGVRTFLIADMRGYTRYGDEHGDEAASELARRFAGIANEAVEARGGEVVELRGDEALCVFASARSAVQGAVELQRRARERVDGEPALPLAVGIGLDVGEAVPTAGGYRGRALNVAARLCSIAKGGEILATETVSHLAGRSDEVEYGRRRPTAVKGIAEPIRFVEVLPKVELPPPPVPSPSPTRRRPARTAALLAAGGLVLAAVATLAAVLLTTSHGANRGRLIPIASQRCSPLRYDGPRSPQLLIAADLPLQPGSLATTRPMVDAMTLALERREYSAGPYRVGLQVCDEAAPGEAPFAVAACTGNAGDYVRNPSVIGVVGPFSSGCAMLEIPILNDAADGPVPVVSPSNTYVGLTRRVPLLGADEPALYYPTGTRNYARVLPPDDVQAAADAIAAQRLGVDRVYVLDDGNRYSIADDFVHAARRLDIGFAGRESLDEAVRNFVLLTRTIERSHADGVFIGVPSSSGSVRLLRGLRASLGGAVQFIAADGFDPDTALLAGPAAEGMILSRPGPPNDNLGREGERFATAFSNKFGAEPNRYAINAAQAIDVLLDAIARSDGTRASVTRNLFTTRISNGILGSFWITRTGDTTLNAVAIYRIKRGKVATFANTIVPDALIGPE